MIGKKSLIHSNLIKTRLLDLTMDEHFMALRWMLLRLLYLNYKCRFACT